MILLELLIAFTVVGWAFYQLYDLKRERRKDEAKRASTYDAD